MQHSGRPFFFQNLAVLGCFLGTTSTGFGACHSNYTRVLRIFVKTLQSLPFTSFGTKISAYSATFWQPTFPFVQFLCYWRAVNCIHHRDHKQDENANNYLAFHLYYRHLNGVRNFARAGVVKCIVRVLQPKIKWLSLPPVTGLSSQCRWTDWWNMMAPAGEETTAWYQIRKNAALRWRWGNMIIWPQTFSTEMVMCY